MPKRLAIALELLAVLGVGVYAAFRFSRLHIYRAIFAGSYTYPLLFKSATWLIPVAALLGIYFGASLRRAEGAPGARRGQILRHDEVAFFEHTAHATSTVLLMVTGTLLGFLFVPRLVTGAQSSGFMLNLHFVGVVVFVFVNFYYHTESWLGHRLGEHWPERDDFRNALLHYACILGLKPGPSPEEGKYLASERLSYVGWVAGVVGILLTGAVKVSAYVLPLPGALMGPVTFLHDLLSLYMVLMLAAHVFFSSLVPWSWPLLRSMMTGYVTEDYAKHHHPKWYREVAGRAGEAQAAPEDKRGALTGGAGLPVGSRG
ncbi:MAG: hypothetical protein ACM3VX_06485 [Bacteroidota bacterium]